MLAYIGRRLLLGAFTIWMITILTFVVIQAPPGDSVSRYIDELMAAGDQPAVLIAERLRAYVGLDEPMHKRYGSWLWNMARGGLRALVPEVHPGVRLLRRKNRSRRSWARGSG